MPGWARLAGFLWQHRRHHVVRIGDRSAAYYCRTCQRGHTVPPR
jgi:hypothetical protein